MGSAGTAWRAQAPRWSPVQRGGVVKLHLHPVNPPAHDRGTAVHGRAPVPDLVYELPFGRIILTRACLGWVRILTSLSVPHEQRSRVERRLYSKSSPSPRLR